MEFRESQPIYLQIAEFVCEKILMKEWKLEERIPSVRELAMGLQVNPNTVMRTYEFLQQKNIIYNQRGVGLFVSPHAYDSALEYRKGEFIQKEMPSFFRSMALLQIEIEELEPLFKKIKKTTLLKFTKL
ncbi:MAG TPA: GntR family transcriptional regulator [Chryseolinea sp.]|nr:GntR family transcriptional regulator [Chryseolinea sp.]